MPPNLVPPETSIQPEASSGQKITESEIIIAPPPTNQLTELMLPSTSAPSEALHQILPRSTKTTRKSPTYYGFGKDDSSGESKNSCLSIFAPPAGKVEPVMWNPCNLQLSTFNNCGYCGSIRANPKCLNFEIHNMLDFFLSSLLIVEELSLTGPRIRPAKQSPPENLIIDEEDMQTQTFDI